MLQHEVNYIQQRKAYLVDENVANTHVRLESELADVLKVLGDFDKNVEAIKANDFLFQFAHRLCYDVKDDAETVAVGRHGNLVRVLGLLLLQVGNLGLHDVRVYNTQNMLDAIVLSEDLTKIG